MIRYLKLLALLFPLFFIECKKRLIDFRNDYCGKWTFEYQTRKTLMGQPDINSSGTYKGEVYYKRHEKKDEEGKKLIYFNFADGWTEAFYMDKKGILYSKCNGKVERGEFSSKSSVNFSTTGARCVGALAGNESYTVTATR